MKARRGAGDDNFTHRKRWQPVSVWGRDDSQDLAVDWLKGNQLRALSLEALGMLSNIIGRRGVALRAAARTEGEVGLSWVDEALAGALFLAVNSFNQLILFP